jgi:hypothetical protein
MGWMYAAMKLVMAPATLRKFHPMSDGKYLATELQDTSLPVEYGGKGPSVKEGLSVPLGDEAAVAQAPTAAAAATPIAEPKQEAAVSETKETNVTEATETPAPATASAAEAPVAKNTVTEASAVEDKPVAAGPEAAVTEEKSAADATADAVAVPKEEPAKAA